MCVHLNRVMRFAFIPTNLVATSGKRINETIREI